MLCKEKSMIKNPAAAGFFIATHRALLGGAHQ
ncbi:hypothetical protein VCA_002776 [Vibrio albensis VL426]|nr:hypothetical protein VCA_002776 [Vibrio cholerae VL426]